MSGGPSAAASERLPDDIVDAAIAWSVRLVGQHADDWLGQLREAVVVAHWDRLAGAPPTQTRHRARA